MKIVDDAFHIESGEEISFHQCASERNHTQYKGGEAFYPYNGSANYFCKAHLSPNIHVWETT